MKIHTLELGITGIGMVTSVGHDARTACAAIRAGISRPSPLHEHMTTSIADHESVPLIGHPIVPLTNGFLSVGRWLQLCHHALRDLLGPLDSQTAAATPSLGRTAIYVWLPDLDSPRFEYDDGVRPQRIPQAFVAPLLAATGIADDLGLVEIRAYGRAGFAALLVEAEHALRSGAARVVILAVDSYVDAHALLWLDEAERLKYDNNPVGLVPGEAAVAVCLELCGREHPERRMARITQAGAVDSEPDHVADRRGLGKVLAAMLDEHVSGLYTDLNGEAWRALAHGFALTQLPAQLASSLAVHHVAGELGDTGEVSALLNLALVARSLQRGYARGRAALVVANADDGAVACVRIERV